MSNASAACIIAGYLDSARIQALALAVIYPPETVVNTLVSEDLSSVASFEMNEFTTWFATQGLANQPVALEKPLCVLTAPDQPCWKAKRSDFPDALVAKPGKLVVTLTKQDVSPNQPLELRQATLIGLPVEAAGPTLDTVMKRYCLRELTIRPDASNAGKAFVSCRPSTPYTRPWLMFYCHSSACRDDRTATIVNDTIASDPDVIALAEAAGEDGHPKGPYVIDVRIAQ